MSGIKIEVADPLKMAWLDTSDLGNAQRIVQIATGRLLWIEDAQAFAHHDGRRWSLERGNIEATRIAHEVIAHIDLEATSLAEIAENPRALKAEYGDWITVEIAQERVDKLRAHAVKSGSASMTAGMLKQVRPFLSAMLDDFDTDPLAYNTLNKTLRFVQRDGTWTVEARPHDPADMLMHVANVAYDPDAVCPYWTARLAMLTPDPEQLAAFQLLYGYTLTGLTADQSFYVHQGKGGDGKSATHMALADLHGDYYRHAGVKSFLQASQQKSGSEHRSDLVRLRGDVRFVTCDEPPPRSVFDGEIIKQATGSFITARGVNGKTEVTYRPRFKLFIECNGIPRAPSDDKGFRRRFKLFMWRVSLSDTAEGEISMDQVLAACAAENPGILNWMIEGALKWLETRKIPQPSAMTEALSDFWADSSPLLEWMGEWCDTSDPNAKESAKALYDHFKEWCEKAGIENIMNQTSFGRSLRDKQHAVVKDGRGTRWRKGIQLRRSAWFGGDASARPPAAPDAAAGPSPASAGSPPEPSAGRASRPWEDDDWVPTDD
ncbi:MAG: phage/plasmid primase, P4 family [Sphingobium sp.]|nr:phage/plasmid primase, P4 family [Sphingobium sp.]